jgi:hypothetical protein
MVTHYVIRINYTETEHTIMEIAATPTQATQLWRVHKDWFLTVEPNTPVGPLMAVTPRGHLTSETLPQTHYHVIMHLNIQNIYCTFTHTYYVYFDPDKIIFQLLLKTWCVSIICVPLDITVSYYYFNALYYMFILTIYGVVLSPSALILL